MKCHYCQRECVDNESTNTYCYCYHCHVNYSLTLQLIVDMVIFRNPQMPDYRLVLHLSDKETLLLYRDDSPFISNMDDPQIVVKLQFIMENVTPQNVQDKIKTMLVFS